MSNEALLGALQPILEVLAATDISDADAAEKALNAQFPIESEAMQALKAMFAKGKLDGWLCGKEAGTSRFSRVAKPCDETKNFSIDAVELTGPGVWHKHTEGEIDLAFAASGDAPNFDGHGEGWAVFAPGSSHVPTVEGGTMDILYFLPNGAVEWKRA